MNNRFTFPKSENLKSNKLIEKVFESGSRQKAYPIRLQYLIHDHEDVAHHVQATFVASKRLFKTAVDRNRLKRQMREAYRLHKSPLIEYAEANNLKFALVFIYMPNEKMDYTTIEKGMLKILDKLVNKDA